MSWSRAVVLGVIFSLDEHFCDEMRVAISTSLSHNNLFVCPDGVASYSTPQSAGGTPECYPEVVQKVTLHTCYAPYVWSDSLNECATQCEIDSPMLALLGECETPENECPSRALDPILTATGESYQPQRADYIGGGAFPIRFSRNYRSYRVPEPTLHKNRYEQLPAEEKAGWIVYLQPSGYTGPVRRTGWNWVGEFAQPIPPIGYRQWQHSYQLSLYQTDSETVVMVRANGHKNELKKQADGVTFVATKNTGDRVVKILDATGELIGWRYLNGRGIEETYDTEGRLVLITNPRGLTQSLSYNTDNQLSAITDSASRSLQLTYDSDNRISQLIQPDGEVIRFNYDANGNPIQIIYPDATPAEITDNPTINYFYSDPRHPYALTGQVDENGDQYATWTFDAAGRATGSSNHNGFKAGTVTYGNQTAIVTEANGQSRALTFDSDRRLVQVAGGNCGQCSASDVAAYTYNWLGQISSRTDFNGIETTYEYNSRGLQIRRTEAAGTMDARVTTTVWHETLSLPLEISSERLKTEFSYGSNGRLEQVTETDLSGPTTVSRSTTWQYNGDGLLQSITTPGGGVTSYTYNAQKDLSSVTNALGHITQISSVDANGRPISLIDPNGLITTLSYDERGQLSDQTVDGKTTTFSYDRIGQLTELTLPNGNITHYHYNGARLLTEVSDTTGNTITYSYDNVGNLLKIEVRDPQGQLHRTQTQIYDQLNRLTTQVGADSQTTQYGYDAVGNRISTTDPLLRQTLNSFDGLNRLQQQTDPAGGITRYQYDSQNHLTSVTDPRDNITTYHYDGFGNLLSQTSPDTGTTSYTYDLAGNQISQTDANKVSVSYHYDLLNRLTQVDYPGDSADLTLIYDQGTNGKGRLTQIIDASGSTSYRYNLSGQLTGKTVSVNGKTFTLSYAYDAAGLLTQITYPSPRQVNYSRSPDGQINRVSHSFGGQSNDLLTSASYQPFGPAKSFTLGNGRNVSRQFDLDGRLTAIDVPGIYQSLLSYNQSNNIIQQQTPLQPTLQQDFSYDNLDRLTEASGLYGNPQYQYDSLSNRTRKTSGTQVETLNYDPLSNRLLSTQAETYQYDANGNRISDNVSAYQYGVHNRLSQIAPVNATDNLKTTTYQYNGLGQRVRKSSIFGEVIYLYDENGLLIAEADGTGRITREYVYFEGQPLTMMVGE